MSPRKLDLVGVSDIVVLLAEMGKVNQETGEPLSQPRVVALTHRSDFPRPWVDARAGRLWRRADVRKWAETWEQREGKPPAKDPQRVATGRIGAYKLHGLYDSKELTKAASAGWRKKFRREAQEAAEARGEKLSEAELERRAASLRKSYMQLMAFEREKRKADPRQGDE